MTYIHRVKHKTEPVTIKSDIGRAASCYQASNEQKDKKGKRQTVDNMFDAVTTFGFDTR
jgi:hypothetical protein